MLTQEELPASRGGQRSTVARTIAGAVRGGRHRPRRRHHEPATTRDDPGEHGLVFGAAMIRFARPRVPLQPRWWLGWHLNAVLLLSSAVHGTVLAAIYRSTIDPAGFEAAQLVTQPKALLLALGSRVYIGRKRGVPLRFTLREERAELVGDADGAPGRQRDERPRRRGARDRFAVAE